MSSMGVMLGRVRRIGVTASRAPSPRTLTSGPRNDVLMKLALTSWQLMKSY